MRTVLFFRKYRRLHGGHLKVWHYFNHTLATDGFDARVLFDVDSHWDPSNPWGAVRDLVVEAPDDVQADAFFVAGRDWQRMEALDLLDRDLPIINFIQHTRHADDWSIQSRYLNRKAIRICVSEEVAHAIDNAGSRGRTIVIPNSIDVPVGESTCQAKGLDLLIAGLKQPEMALRIAASLQQTGRSIEVLVDHVHESQSGYVYRNQGEFIDAVSRVLALGSGARAEQGAKAREYVLKNYSEAQVSARLRAEVDALLAL